MPITVGNLGRLGSVSQRGRDIVFSFESSDLVLTPLLPNVIRHTWVPTHWRLYAERVTDAYAVNRSYWPAGPAFTITETADMVRVHAGELVIEATRDPFHIRYFTADRHLFLEEAPEGGLSWSYWDYSLRYQITPADHFYGLGQASQLTDHLDLDQRGQLLDIWNQHSPPAATVFPALLSLSGYGMLVDNPHRAVWDLGHTNQQVLSYRARGGGLQYYIWYGPDLPRLLRSFLELTGFPPLPPRWALGLLQSRYGYRNRDELETIAQTFRAKDLPCDALILDVFWFREMGDLDFDHFDWPEPREMIARLRERGFRIMVIEEPYLTTRSRNYADALANGYMAKHFDGSPYTFDFWPGRCGLLDFSNPATRAWWSEKHKSLLELGIGGWWTDLNEPAKHFQDMAHHGGSAAAVHNVTALYMHQSIFDAHQQYAPQQRVFILSRSAFPGSHRYGAALWSGDVDMTFASLRKQVTVGLNVGLSGISLWGTDIGGFGFGGQCTPELYVRWFQFGAFCPLFRPHGDQTELREPWQFGPEVEAICRKYLRLRYRLFPYVYTGAHEACTTGIPIMRPLVLAFPKDPEVLNLSDEYLFGPDILVAPILNEGATERIVYFPAGTWVDLWSDAVYTGPRSVNVSAPLDTLPLFVRQGAILPMGPDVQYSSERPLDPLTLEIYRGADHSFTLYEDDGETTAYQNGAYVRTRFEVTESQGALLCTIGEPEGSLAGYQPGRTIVLNVHQQPATHEVNCDGTVVSEVADRKSLDESEFGWWLNLGSGTLTVKLRQTARALTVRVS
jgi:alpha-glucosidase (family GH31 glycosyl hydrolase)